MRFFTLITIATVSLANTTPNDVLIDLFTKAEQLQTLFNFNIVQNSKLTRDDLLKVLPNLASTDNIKDLLVNEKVSFSLKGLSIPEKDANKDIVYAISETKAWAKSFIKSYIAKKTDASTIEETKQGFRESIEAWTKDGSLNESIEKVDALFAQHPELPKLTSYLVAALPEVFDKEELDYAKLFLTEAHASHPELAANLALLIDGAQKKYSILPEPQFNHLKSVFASFK